MILTPNQIGLLIYEVGGWGPPAHLMGSANPDKNKQQIIGFLDTAIAVAHGESGWDTQALNNYKGVRMIGLYQINEAAHGDKIKASIRRWSAELGKPVDAFHPLVNIDVAREVYNEAGHTWQPWQAFTDNSPGYRSGLGHGAAVYKYLNSEKQVNKRYQELLANIAESQNTADIANLNPIGVAAGTDWSPQSILGSVLPFLKSSGITIGVFLIAIVAIILGVWFVVSNTSLGKTVIRKIP